MILIYFVGVTIKKLNKLVNADIKHLVIWLNANKISLNIKKTETVIFKSKQNKFECHLKNLDVKFDTNLSWQYHVNDLSIKLNRANVVVVVLQCCRIINFQPRNSHTHPLYKQSSILTFQGKFT